MIRVGIVIGSTRPGRKAEVVARWAFDIERKRKDAEFELVDIAEFNLPLLDEPMPAMFGQYSHDHTRVWSAKIASFDGSPMSLSHRSTTTAHPQRSKTQSIVCTRNGPAKRRDSSPMAGQWGSRRREFATRLGRAASQKHVNDMLDQLIAWSGALKPLRSK